MPATLWAPSTTTSGWRPTTSRRPGHPHGGERLLDHVLVEGRAEEGLDRGQAHGGVVPLVGTVQRHQHLPVGGARGAHVDQPPTDGQPVGGAGEVVAPDPDLGRPGRRRPPGRSRATRVGIGLADDHPAVRP